MVSILTSFRSNVGDVVFLPVMGIFALFLSIKLIPWATDLMVNSAAGLAGEHLGRQYRTLVINCSTNNPELATMIISLFFIGGAKRYGGIGTPLGSNFANIYLIFLVALMWTLLRLWLRNRNSFHKLIELVKCERQLVTWHLSLSFVMFFMAFVAFRLLPTTMPPNKLRILLAGVFCLGGTSFYVWRELALRKKRPELFEDIDEEDHVASWQSFAMGTAGLIVCCYLLNIMFLVATDLYGATLSFVLGPAVFAMMHYLLGALVTSLPEMNVAVANYERIESPDLNTALASASASNMSNLAIAGLGCLIALFL